MIYLEVLFSHIQLYKVALILVNLCCSGMLDTVHITTLSGVQLRSKQGRLNLRSLGLNIFHNIPGYFKIADL